MTRRLLAVLLAALCFAQSAMAAWFPGLDVFADAEEVLSLTVTARVDHAQDLSPLTLEALAALLPRTELRLTTAVFTNGEQTDARLTVDESPLLTFALFQGLDSSTAAVNGRGYTGVVGSDPLAGLLDADAFPLPLPSENLARALSGDLPELWTPLSDSAQAEARSRTLKGAGTARRQVRYLPTEEAWAAAWPQAARLLADTLLAPGPANAQLQAWLSTLRFDGPVDLRLYTARDETPLGWQFTGIVLAQDYTPRKVTLLAAHAPDKGLHLSLRAKAAESADDLSFQFTVQQAREKDRGTLRGDAVWNWRVGKLRDSGNARLSLTARDTSQGETVKGTLSLDIPARGSRPRRVTRLTPDLLLSDGALSGTTSLTQQEAGRDALDMTFALHVGTQPFAPAALPQDGVNAATLDAAALAEERGALQSALLQPLTQLLLTLPQDQRLALIHDMGRTARTQGDSVPPLNNYQVIGEPANEEDTP